jgi:hypothetical protein
MRANCGFVANIASSGTPAAAHLSRSSVHDFGRYSSRSMRTRVPFAGTAYTRNTPTWQFVIFPAVPVYCRCTPAECFPDFSNQSHRRSARHPGRPAGRPRTGPAPPAPRPGPTPRRSAAAAFHPGPHPRHTPPRSSRSCAPAPTPAPARTTAPAASARGARTPAPAPRRTWHQTHPASGQGPHLLRWAPRPQRDPSGHPQPDDHEAAVLRHATTPIPNSGCPIRPALGAAARRAVPSAGTPLG